MYRTGDINQGKRRGVGLSDLHEILSGIDPSALDYGDWVAVGMGIKHEGGTAEDWATWSARGSDKYKEGECQSKWAGFKGSGTPVTLGTLIEFAKRNGWSPSRVESHHQTHDWDSIVNNPNESDVGWVAPTEVEVPKDGAWDPADDIRRYLSTLFDTADHVGYVVDSYEADDGRRLPKKGSYSKTAGELLEELSRYNGDMGMVFGETDPEVGAWIRFNALDGKGVCGENVTSYRYALVEADTIDIEKQAAMYKELELPIATLVHSGKRSLHAVVRIDAVSKEEYRGRVNYLYSVCKDRGLDLDTQNKDPSRLSRMPGVMRGGKKQFLVGVNQGKESWEAWKKSIEEANDDLPEFESLVDTYNDLPDLAPALIEGLLRMGHKMMVAGPSKAGKSWLLMQLALAVAEGGEWLGWPCKQGKVLYVNLEIDRASFLHRTKILYEGLGWAPENIKNLDIWNLRGHATPMDQLAPKLIRRAKKRDYAMIIIDPIYKVITGDENAADKMAYFCNQFDTICKQLKSAVVYCHHHSKGGQGQKSAQDRGSGSGVFARDPDVLVDLTQVMVTDGMRKAMTDHCLIGAASRLMNKINQGWQSKFSQDDLLSPKIILEYSRGQIPNLDDLMRPLRDKLAYSTGWRIEGILREFAPMAPRELWFRHPFHTLEGAEYLVDAKIEGEEAPWKAEYRAKAEIKTQHKDQILNAFNQISPHNPDGPVSMEALTGACGLTEEQVTSWLKGGKGLALCSDNNIRSGPTAKLFETGEHLEFCLKDGDTATIATVMDRLGKGRSTAHKAIDGHPGYERKDGIVTRVNLEGEKK